MTIYVTNWELRRNGTIHPPGAEVRLSDEEAEKLGSVVTQKSLSEGAELPQIDEGVEEVSMDRIDLIRGAIRNLDASNPEHYTDANIPRVVAIEKVLGFDITAEERDAALA